MTTKPEVLLIANLLLKQHSPGRSAMGVRFGPRNQPVRAWIVCSDDHEQEVNGLFAVKLKEAMYDHDPLAPSDEALADAESSLLAAMCSTPDSHPEADLCRGYQPLDLKPCKDT